MPSAAWFLPTSCGAEVDQQQLLSGAKLVGHGADHLPPRRRHGHPDSCVRVITAVDLQKDCGNADRGQARSGQVKNYFTQRKSSSHLLTVVLIPDGLFLLQPLLAIAKLSNQSFLAGESRQSPSRK